MNIFTGLNQFGHHHHQKPTHTIYCGCFVLEIWFDFLFVCLCFNTGCNHIKKNLINVHSSNTKDDVSTALISVVIKDDNDCVDDDCCCDGDDDVVVVDGI